MERRRRDGTRTERVRGEAVEMRDRVVVVVVGVDVEYGAGAKWADGSRQ